MIDPEVLAALAEAEQAFPEPALANRQQQRERINRMTDHMVERVGEPGPPVRSVADHTIPVAGGTIDVRLFHPDADGPLPALVYLHGGAFWQGTAVQPALDALCRERCAAGYVVASVEYRLAPEHQFPGPVEDCHAAVAWLAAEHAALGVDPERIVVGGGSAGGNLAAAVALLARERGPRIHAQLLEVPALDLTGGHLVDVGNGLMEDAIADLHAVYGTDGTPELASPLLAADLSGLPQALVMVAEHDELRGDGEAYVRALTAAGTPAQLYVGVGHAHPTMMFTRIFPPAKEWRAEALRWLGSVTAWPAAG